MQTLLPLEHFAQVERFEHMVNLEPIKVKNRNSPNKNITSAVDPAEPQKD